MKKRLLYSTLLLCFLAVLLITVLVTRPHPTHAAAAPTPVLVVSPRTLSNANCTPIALLTSDMSSGYQVCTLTISTTTKWIPTGLHWSVTASAQFCYKSCSSPASGYLALIKGAGGTLYGSGIGQQVTILVPRNLVEGVLQATWTITGPGNTVKVTGAFY